jgi:hypothetical protein
MVAAATEAREDSVAREVVKAMVAAAAKAAAREAAKAVVGKVEVRAEAVRAAARALETMADPVEVRVEAAPMEVGATEAEEMAKMVTMVEMEEQEVKGMVVAVMVVVMAVEMAVEMAAAARVAVVREAERAGAAMVGAAKENRKASTRESRQGSGSASVEETHWLSELSSRSGSHRVLAAAAHCLPRLTRSRMQTGHALLARSDSDARRVSMCWTDSRQQTGRPTAGRARADPSSSRTDCK